MSNILPVRTVMVEIAHIQQAVDYLILAVDEGKKQRYRKEHIARIEQAQEAITRAVRGGLDAAIRDAMGTKPGQFGSRLRFLVAQIRTTAWSICDPSYDAVSHPAVQQMRAAADKLHTLWQRLAYMDESRADIDATIPADCITFRVAVKRYLVSRETLKRLVRDGVLKSYRPKNAPKNAEHLISEAELAKRYALR